MKPASGAAAGLAGGVNSAAKAICGTAAGIAADRRRARNFTKNPFLIWTPAVYETLSHITTPPRAFLAYASLPRDVGGARTSSLHSKISSGIASPIRVWPDRKNVE